MNKKKMITKKEIMYTKVKIIYMDMNNNHNSKANKLNNNNKKQTEEFLKIVIFLEVMGLKIVNSKKKDLIKFK